MTAEADSFTSELADILDFATEQRTENKFLPPVKGWSRDQVVTENYPGKMQIECPVSASLIFASVKKKCFQLKKIAKVTIHTSVEFIIFVLSSNFPPSTCCRVEFRPGELPGC